MPSAKLLGVVIANVPSGCTVGVRVATTVPAAFLICTCTAAPAGALPLIVGVASLVLLSPTVPVSLALSSAAEMTVDGGVGGVLQPQARLRCTALLRSAPSLLVLPAASLKRLLST